MSDEPITDASITYGVYDATSMHFGKTVTRDNEDLIAFIQGIDLVELFLSNECKQILIVTCDCLAKVNTS